MNLTPTVVLLCLAGILQACSERDSDLLVDSNGNNAASNNSNVDSTVNPNSAEIKEDDSTAGAILSTDNYTDIVGYALTFFANEQFPEPAFRGPDPQDFSNPLSSTIDSQTGLEMTTYVCTNGGTATRTDREADIDLFEFINCQYNDSLLDGQMGYSFGKYGSTREFIGLTSENNGTSIHEATGYLANYLGAPCSHDERTRAVSSYTITQGDQVFKIKDWNSEFEREKYVNVEYCGESDYVVIGGGFSIQSVDTGNNELRVDATETITGKADNPTAGVVTITATDDSSITIDFNSGDDTTVVVSISNSQGINTFVEPLASWVGQLLPL